MKGIILKVGKAYHSCIALTFEIGCAYFGEEGGVGVGLGFGI